MRTDRCGNTSGQKCCAKGSGEENKIQKFMYRDKSMWNKKCMFILVITAATGIITKLLKKILKPYHEKENIK